MQPSNFSGDDVFTSRAMQLGLQLLIVLSLLAFSLETLPNLPPLAQQWLYGAEVFFVVAFTLEYIVRATYAKPTSSYVLSFFGVVDLLSILPFFLGAAFDLRALRAFRLLRLFRVLKLARYNAAMRRFHLALTVAKEEFVLFICAALVLIFLAAVGIYYFESTAQPEQFASVFHCLWWAVSTLTTVGYGDIYPVTVGGKLFTFFILIIGLGVISVPAGLFASALAKAREIEASQPVELRESD